MIEPGFSSFCDPKGLLTINTKNSTNTEYSRGTKTSVLVEGMGYVSRQAGNRYVEHTQKFTTYFLFPPALAQYFC